MGGDHKCPVCQATFTRPQHVARHMRSHTGDRPYKCQHCGDQFARSDLLSRHVNKCHANEKPLTNSGNSRRKGSASATRATTSKQACDQCVQSSLPCDGCNPCAKCVQRKCRCTFVKFHRQTAPIGPGHNPRASGANGIPPSLGSIGSLGGLGGINSMGLGVNGINSVPSMNPNLVASMGIGGLGGVGGINAGLNGQPLTSMGSLSLLPPGSSASGLAANNLASRGIPLYQQNASAAAAAAAASEAGGPSSGTGEDFLAAAAGANGDNFTPSQFSFPSVYGTSSSVTSGVGTVGNLGGVSGLDEYANKFRAQQAELMRRGSIGHGYSSHHSQGQQRPHSSHASSGSPTNWSMGNVNGWSTEPESYHHAQSRNFMDDGRMHVYGHGNRERRLSGEFSDASVSGGESGSLPSSAASSSVHLPLDNTSSYSLNSSRHSGSPPNNDGSRPGTSHGEGGFHNAFGLLSLDDPAVLAGLQNDGTPFFSIMDQLGPEGMQNFGAIMEQSGDPNATPMPDKLQQLHAQAQAHVAQVQAQHGHQSAQNGGFVHPSSSYSGRPSTGHGYPLPPYGMHGVGSMMTPGSREQETKQLKDFWKEFMRTPLSGPGGGILTPGRDKDRGRDGDVHMLSPGLHGPSNGYRRQRVSSLPSVKTPTPLDEAGTTSFYGSFGVTPNEKSYTQNGSRSHPNTSQVLPPVGVPAVPSGTHHGNEDLRSYEAAVLARKAPTTLNLVPRVKKKATIDGSPQSHDASISPPPSSMNPSSMTSIFQSHSPSTSSSRESSSSLDDHGSDSVSRRPSYKRLASQTLESQHVKRALLHRDKDSIEEFDFDESSSSNSPSNPMASRSTSAHHANADNEEALADDEDDSEPSSKRHHFNSHGISIPNSTSASSPASSNASPIIGTQSNSFLGLGGSPNMMYGSVPGKTGQTLMQQALLSGSSSGSPMMGISDMTEKRRRMSVPTSKSPTSMSFVEAGQL